MSTTITSTRTLPATGVSQDEILDHLRELKSKDVNWRGGRIQGMHYFAGEDVQQIAEAAYQEYFQSNPLSAKAHPSLAELQNDIVSIASNLFHAPEAAGVVTTGGTESNLLAVLGARNRAREERGVTDPEIVIPENAHPSFSKAGAFFNVRVKRIPMADDFRADVEAMRAAVTDNTVMLVGSAPEYTHGMIDPIPEIAAIAAERNLDMHVDACVGGYFLPFLEMNGTDVSGWDFRVPGVTSISADLHKHGFAAKGVSTLIRRSQAAVRFHEFAFNDWPNGRYFTQVVGGTRAGGSIAAAWAVLNYLGIEGYRRINAECMETTRRFQDGINEIPGLEVWGTPVSNKFSFGSRVFDITAIVDGMEARGWFIGLQKTPPGINMHVLPTHAAIVDEYLADLAEVANAAMRGELEGTGREAAYN